MPPRIKIAVAVAFAFIALFIVREATALDLPADDPVGVISLVVPATQPPEPQPAESADTLVPNPITPEIPIPESPPVTTPGPPPTAAQVVPTVPLRPLPAPAPPPPSHNDLDDHLDDDPDEDLDDDLDDRDDDDD